MVLNLNVILAAGPVLRGEAAVGKGGPGRALGALQAVSTAVATRKQRRAKKFTLRVCHKSWFSGYRCQAALEWPDPPRLRSRYPGSESRAKRSFEGFP
jgi:hypothetical protein